MREIEHLSHLIPLSSIGVSNCASRGMEELTACLKKDLLITASLASKQELLSRTMSAEWTPPSPAEQRELEEKRKRSDEMSAKMSDMLLRGWKMLNEYCPVSGDVPLMQNREGRKFSVALDKFVDELDGEGVEEAGGESGAAAAPEAPSEAPPNVAVAPAAPAAPTAAPSPVAPPPPRSPAAAATGPRSPAAAGAISRSPATAAAAGTTLTAPRAVPTALNSAASPLDAALAQVTATVEQCTAQLSTSSSAADTENLVRLIGQSALTISQLKAAGAR